MRKSKQTLISLGPSCDSVSWQTWSEKWGSWDSWFRTKLQAAANVKPPADHSRLRKLVLPMIDKPLRKARTWSSPPR